MNNTIGGAGNPKWNGGIHIDKSGYILILSPDHPRRDSGGYVREHRLVVEESLGRYLTTEEVVHHVNGSKDDNRLENLRVMSPQEHMSLHSSGRDSKVAVICEWCSKEFKVFPSRLGKRATCSYVCMGKNNARKRGHNVRQTT